ncbi:DUF4920 domain-containing protein [Flavobacteriaceae bacterium TP-CH-4]|uniref:DUF4920 domain-containing protein n=1 Tax=Pelagihabitans pacificus TaxID=2696054 RepID=A0A967E408_9FLAO|nr:DUF4920 domain-containing protein [Pelagihabitans pacificus]NHF57902.1 DUF4920 domain-containing protein [Pelagihabitans pacificus]
MKRFNILLVIFFVMCACKGQDGQIDKNQEQPVAKRAKLFGAAVDENESLSTSEMSDRYRVMAVADTVPAKFTAEVVEVCQAKGCWMKVMLKDGQEAMVRFKDYGFFMPKDIAGREVVVDGLAFIEEMSVEDQIHYAQDAGQPETEMAKITKPKKNFGFEASGVLLKQ